MLKCCDFAEVQCASGSCANIAVDVCNIPDNIGVNVPMLVE